MSPIYSSCEPGPEQTAESCEKWGTVYSYNFFLQSMGILGEKVKGHIIFWKQNA